jgi:putative PIN family toxin of toxin-antitoxin system
MNKLKLVLDTNVLLVSISSQSSYHWLFQKLLLGAFDMCLTHDILIEYEEVISQKWNPEIAKNVLRTLLLLPHVHQVITYYHWNLIYDDADDNKFVDCAVSANAHYLVTHDKHFNVLKTIDFPKIEIITLNELEKILNSRLT